MPVWFFAPTNKLDKSPPQKKQFPSKGKIIAIDLEQTKFARTTVTTDKHISDYQSLRQHSELPSEPTAITVILNL